MLTSSTARRINKSFLVLLALTSLCLSAIAQQTTRNPQASPGKPAVVPVADTAGTQKLPLRRIVLYKSGVGYFEHAGNVRGNAGVEIDLTSSQLDDVLKSLTALDLNGGRIVGASYNSEEPIGHQFSRFPCRWLPRPRSRLCWRNCAALVWRCGPPPVRSPGGC